MCEYCWQDLNLQSCTVADVEFQSEFSLVAKDEGQVTAIVGFFDVEFQSVPHKKSFSTSPHNIPTHWKQAVFLLQQPISVVAGEWSGWLGKKLQINIDNWYVHCDWIKIVL